MISHSLSASSLPMPNVPRRHTVATLILGALLAPTTAALGTVEYAAAVTGRAITSLQDDDVPEVVFAELKTTSGTSKTTSGTSSKKSSSPS